MLQGVVDQVPESFLARSAQDQPPGSALATAAAQRQAYLDYFAARVADRARWLRGPSVRALELYDYAVIRVVPRVSARSSSTPA